MIEYREVSVSDASFLYHILEERDKNVNISHRRMPTWEEHVEFISTWKDRYKVWYIILLDGREVGVVYLTKVLEIGIQLLKESQRQGIGTRVVEFITKEPGRYLANINPKNKISEKFFKKFSFRLIQHTYEKLNDQV